MTAIIHLAFLRMLLSATRTGKSKLMQAASFCKPWALDSPKLLTLQDESIAIQIDTHMHIETRLINWMTQKMVAFSHILSYSMSIVCRNIQWKNHSKFSFLSLIFRYACGRLRLVCRTLPLGVPRLCSMCSHSDLERTWGSSFRTEPQNNTFGFLYRVFNCFYIVTYTYIIRF